MPKKIDDTPKPQGGNTPPPSSLPAPQPAGARRGRPPKADKQTPGDFSSEKKKAMQDVIEDLKALKESILAYPKDFTDKALELLQNDDFKNQKLKNVFNEAIEDNNGEVEIQRQINMVSSKLESNNFKEAMAMLVSSGESVGDNLVMGVAAINSAIASQGRHYHRRQSGGHSTYVDISASIINAYEQIRESKNLRTNKMSEITNSLATLNTLGDPRTLGFEPFLSIIGIDTNNAQKELFDKIGRAVIESGPVERIAIPNFSSEIDNYGRYIINTNTVQEADLNNYVETFNRAGRRHGIEFPTNLPHNLTSALLKWMLGDFLEDFSQGEYNNKTRTQVRTLLSNRYPSDFAKLLMAFVSAFDTFTPEQNVNMLQVYKFDNDSGGIKVNMQDAPPAVLFRYKNKTYSYSTKYVLENMLKMSSKVFSDRMTDEPGVITRILYKSMMKLKIRDEISALRPADRSLNKIRQVSHFKDSSLFEEILRELGFTRGGSSMFYKKIVMAAKNRIKSEGDEVITPSPAISQTPPVAPARQVKSPQPKTTPAQSSTPSVANPLARYRARFDSIKKEFDSVIARKPRLTVAEVDHYQRDVQSLLDTYNNNYDNIQYNDALKQDLRTEMSKFIDEISGHRPTVAGEKLTLDQIIKRMNTIKEATERAMASKEELGKPKLKFFLDKITNLIKIFADNYDEFKADTKKKEDLKKVMDGLYKDLLSQYSLGAEIRQGADIKTIQTSIEAMAKRLKDATSKKEKLTKEEFKIFKDSLNSLFEFYTKNYGSIKGDEKQKKAVKRKIDDMFHEIASRDMSEFVSGKKLTIKDISKSLDGMRRRIKEVKNEKVRMTEEEFAMELEKLKMIKTMYLQNYEMLNQNVQQKDQWIAIMDSLSIELANLMPKTSKRMTLQETRENIDRIKSKLSDINEGQNASEKIMKFLDNSLITNKKTRDANLDNVLANLNNPGRENLAEYVRMFYPEFMTLLQRSKQEKAQRESSQGRISGRSE
jgi:hypothetical protein